MLPGCFEAGKEHPAGHVHRPIQRIRVGNSPSFRQQNRRGYYVAWSSQVSLIGGAHIRQKIVTELINPDWYLIETTTKDTVWNRSSTSASTQCSAKSKQTFQLTIQTKWWILVRYENWTTFPSHIQQATSTSSLTLLWPPSVKLNQNSKHKFPSSHSICRIASDNTNRGGKFLSEFDTSHPTLSNWDQV